MAAISELFHVDAGQQRITFGITINEIAVNAVKEQRLRVFRANNYVEADCKDDDDEFEERTVYFAAYSSDALMSDSVNGSVEPEALKENLIGGLTAYPGEQSVPFSVQEVFEFDIPKQIAGIDHSYCFYLRTIVCERPRNLKQKMPPRFFSAGLIYAMMLHAKQRGYVYTYSIFKEPLWRKMKSLDLPFKRIKGDIIYEDRTDPYLFEGSPVFPVYGLVDDLLARLRQVFAEEMQTTIVFPHGLDPTMTDGEWKVLANIQQLRNDVTDVLKQTSAITQPQTPPVDNLTVSSDVLRNDGSQSDAEVSKGLPLTQIVQATLDTASESSSARDASIGAVRAASAKAPSVMNLLDGDGTLQSVDDVDHVAVSVPPAVERADKSVVAPIAALRASDGWSVQGAASSRVALFYHPDLIFHPGGYCEAPGRVAAVWQKCVDAGLAQQCLLLHDRTLVAADALALVHDRDYAELLCKYDGSSTDEETVTAVCQDDSDTMFTDKSVYCARLAVGGLLSVVDRVLMGVTPNGAAIIRPPGHHAGSAAARGFCLVNNVAIAAVHAMRSRGVRRVLIVDWDAHFGDGVHELLRDVPDALYVSLHRHDDGEYYPGNGHASLSVADGVKPHISVPWPCAGFGDADYIYVFHHLIMPIAYEFEPELVLISGGFDSAMGDPKGGLSLTPAGFGHLTSMLQLVGGNRTVLALEGGYDLFVTANCFAASLSALLGHSPPPLRGVGGAVRAETKQLTAALRQLHAPHWQCLQ